MHSNPDDNEEELDDMNSQDETCKFDGETSSNDESTIATSRKHKRLSPRGLLSPSHCGSAHGERHTCGHDRGRGGTSRK